LGENVIPVLPDEIADLLDDATPACDAASDAEVDAFLATHTDESRPAILAGWTKALGKHFSDGASRHQSTVSVLVGAMKEARAGYYPAQDAAKAIQTLFLDAVAKPPTSGKQGAARNGKVAASEFYGILAWAVAQANAADLAEVRERADKQMPDNTSWMTNGQAAPAATVGPAPVAQKHRSVLSVEHLEQDFWDPDELRQIYDDALGRMLSPWAVLTHCVARVLAKVRPCVVLRFIAGQPVWDDGAA
jgi:hypothetical protein